MGSAVTVRNLVKVYEGGVRALNGVDLDVDQGSIFSLIGPNGAGKTTLMRILTTQLKPTFGEAYVFGLNVLKHGDRVRKLVSYVPQEISVWTDVSGYENLLIYAKIYRLPSNERRRAVEEALENMGLTELRNKLVNTYSGGMIRRLEIASALMMKPKILFLDEPTIGLDPSARKVIWEKLTSFKKEYGVTVFFNTHYMDEAEHYSDEVAIINRGAIVKRGSVKELEQSVGGEVVRIALNTHEVEGLLKRIKETNSVRKVIFNDSELTVIVNDAETALPSIMEAARREKVTVKRVSITKPSLDDVFLKYAGTRLESGGEVTEVKRVRGAIKRG
ncbi:MAG: ATP-binding cassette domain-containing protein [Candidatus Bathyarchaeia archaeon]